MVARTVQHGAFREQVPTPVSWLNAASKACVDPVSSNGGLVILQLPDQKNLKRTLVRVYVL